jgi:hypothetical protein
MAGVLIGAGVGLAVGSITAPAHAWIHANLVPSYDPEERAKVYKANVQIPNLIPQIGDLLRTYFSGECTRAELDKILALHGATTGELKGFGVAKDWWNKHLQVVRPRLPFEVAMRAEALGFLDTSELQDNIRYHGFRYATDRLRIMEDSLSLDYSFLLQLVDRGVITEDDFVKYMRHGGWRLTSIRDLLKKQSIGIDPQTTMLRWNRGVISEEDVVKQLKWSGYRDNDVIAAMKGMRWQWPGINESIRWLQYGAFDDSYVDKQKLDSEQTPEYQQLAKAAGAKWALGDPIPQGWPTPDVSPADYAWRAHWRPNDIATAITMFHRLRPSKDDPSKSNFTGIKPYTEEDFAKDLSLNAIPPGRRDQLRAVSYNLPRFTVYRQALEAGAIDRNEVVERLQDGGYDVKTATVLRDTWEHLLYQRQIDKLRPISLENVKQAYRVGTMDRGTAAINLHIIFLDDFAKIQAYLASGYTRQAEDATANPWVQMALTLIDSDINAELVKQAVEVTHKALLRLEMTATQAISDLVGIGITYQRAAQYVQLWTYEQATEGTEIKAGQLADWYVNQLIDQDTFRERLLLLGYSRGDAALTIARAQIRLNETLQKMEAETEKAQALQAKQLAAAMKALQAQQTRVHKDMCRSSTRSQVVQFYTKGFVTREEAKSRLVECGMTDDDAENMIKLAEDKQSVKQQKKTAKTANGQSTATQSQLASAAPESAAGKPVER